MKFTGLRWRAAAAIAFLMGLPMVERAEASDGGNIFRSAIDLLYSIIDVAGDS